MYHKEKEVTYTKIIATKIIRETEKAYLAAVPISVGPTEEKKIWDMWLPKSQVEMRNHPSFVLFVVPNWLLDRQRDEMQDEYGMEVKIAILKEE